VIFISSDSAVQIPVEGTAVTVNSVLPGATLPEGVTDFVAKMGKQKNMCAQQVEKEFFENARPQVNSPQPQMAQRCR
jgi:hypothetical protein